MKKQLFILAIAVFVVSVYALLRNGPTKTVPAGEVSYAKDVQPILESRCSQCHMGEHVNKDLHMDTYEALLTGSQNGPVIIPGNAAGSLLVQKVASGKMPKRGPQLTPVQIQIIKDWIDAGAPNN
jgi:hypothetical protein